MKNAFDGLIIKLHIVEEKIKEFEDWLKETLKIYQTETQSEQEE